MPGPTPNEMKSLNSEHILGARYDHPAQKLVIEFRAGRTYEYSGVPQAIADQFMYADSHGQFFHRHIKGRFPHKEL